MEGTSRELLRYDQAPPECRHQRRPLRRSVRADRAMAFGADARISRLRQGGLRADDREPERRPITTGAAFAEVSELRQERQSVEGRRQEDDSAAPHRLAGPD